ncbi:MAG: sulfurtransferase [Gemmatimonadetes bacterium]|nr:sulfurtransferase [Gemmatimonadota bacterium]
MSEARTTIVSAAELAENIGRWRVLDCRAVIGDPDGGRAKFETGHIPGAQYADLDRHLAAAPGTGGRHPLPDPEDLRDAFQAWGINDDDQIVVYDDAGGAYAGRAWWLARWLGHEKVAVLDGGTAAWNGPWMTNADTPEPGTFSIRASLVRVIDATAIEAGLGSGDAKAAHTLIDARSQARFEAREDPFDDILGHIPGAHCVPFDGNLGPDGLFRSPEELRARFESFRTNPVCYCGSGVTAAHNVLAMLIAGLPEPALYPGSWSEWIRDPDRPRVP